MSYDWEGARSRRMAAAKWAVRALIVATILVAVWALWNSIAT
jgi:hypothetical protein